MKKLICLVIITIFYGCDKNTDPFQNVKFGKISSKSFIEKMLTKKILNDPKIDLVYQRDTLSYKYDLKDKKGSIPTKLKINSQDYNFGNVRKLSISLNEPIGFFHEKDDDSIEKIRLERVQRIYTTWYGRPDTVQKIIGYYNGQSIKEKQFVWNRKDYKIFMNNISLTPNFDTRVIYEMLDYENEMKKLKDSIFKNQTIDDLIEISFLNTSWKDLSEFSKEFKIQIYTINRKDKYDKRAVKSLRFDVIITDEFNKELYKSKNFTYELESPLHPKEVTYSTSSNSPVYITTYDIRNPHFKNLEFTRKYRKQHKIKTKANITAVVMDDQTVIKE